MPVSEILQYIANRVEHENNTASGERPFILVDTTFGDVRCVLVRTTDANAARHVQLSPREQEIARLIGQGLPNKTIARVLDISIWTVGTHLRRLFIKLGVGSRAAMIAKISSGSSFESGTAHPSVQRERASPR